MKQNQQGVALIAAIFLVVVIGAALVLMASLALRGSQQTTQGLLQMRSQSAAASAIEFGAQSLINGVACTDPALQGALVITGFEGFTISISCVSEPYNRPPQTITLFTITATAEYGSITRPDYVWSKLNATLEL